MEKWDYIRLISKESNRTGDKLIELMKLHNKRNLQEITCEEAKMFWEQMNK